jgi:hypothetical protein
MFSGEVADRHPPTGPTTDAADVYHPGKEGVRLLTWGDPYLIAWLEAVRRETPTEADLRLAAPEEDRNPLRQHRCPRCSTFSSSPPSTFSSRRLGVGPRLIGRPRLFGSRISAAPGVLVLHLFRVEVSVPGPRDRNALRIPGQAGMIKMAWFL